MSYGGKTFLNNKKIWQLFISMVLFFNTNVQLLTLYLFLSYNQYFTRHTSAIKQQAISCAYLFVYVCKQ